MANFVSMKHTLRVLSNYYRHCKYIKLINQIILLYPTSFYFILATIYLTHLSRWICIRMRIGTKVTELISCEVENSENGKLANKHSQICEYICYVPSSPNKNV